MIGITLSVYEEALQNYTLEQLRYKAAEDVWSIGQLYDHLIGVSLEYLSHVQTCASSMTVQPELKTKEGEETFKAGQFPSIRIKLPDSPEFAPRNPESKESIVAGLQYVLELLNDWKDRVDSIDPGYKVRHGGFGWLNASEWYRLVDMHNRHHLRQKAELDQRLHRKF